MALQFFRMSRKRPEEAKASAAAPVIAFQGAGRVAWSPRDTATLTRIGFLGNPVAFRCVKVIAEAASAVPVVVQDADRHASRRRRRCLPACNRNRSFWP